MRVLIVDDNAIVRMGLNRVLDRIEGVDVVAEAGDGVEAIEVAAAFAPDIVLLDVRMPRMDGLEALPRLASAAKVIMLTSADDAETITAAISAGACGYLVLAGFLLPVLMGQLQIHAGQARGTVSSLSNTAMYLGATIAGAIGGGLLARIPGFWGPSLVTAAAFLLAIGVYGVAGALASE